MKISEREKSRGGRDEARLLKVESSRLSYFTTGMYYK